jgi:hypothetical protein
MPGKGPCFGKVSNRKFSPRAADHVAFSPGILDARPTAPCKTVFTQRLKRSGMRWHKESGQVIVDLRVLYLSGIWQEVVRSDLRARQLPEEVSVRPQARSTRRKAA